MAVYRIVLEKYINNEIDFTTLDEKEANIEKALGKKMSKYKNPYELVGINK